MICKRQEPSGLYESMARFCFFFFTTSCLYFFCHFFPLIYVNYIGQQEMTEESKREYQHEQEVEGRCTRLDARMRVLRLIHKYNGVFKLFLNGHALGINTDP